MSEAVREVVEKEKRRSEIIGYATNMMLRSIESKMEV
jgi:hypothetical protein